DLRRDVALIHADVAVIALDLLAGLGRGGAGVAEYDVDRFAGEPPGLLHHAPKPEIVLDIDRRAGLGPAAALPHIFVAGGPQNAFGGVGERARLAPAALKIGVLEAREIGLMPRVAAGDDRLELVERGARGAEDRRHQRHVIGTRGAAE